MSVVHPRLRARRIDVARQAGRRRLRRVGVALGVAGAALVAAVTVHSPLLDVDRVAIQGAERTASADIVSAAGLGGGEAILTVDVSRVRQSVEALPWVSQARVERQLPATVRIEITERTPDAVVATSAGSVMVDSDGRVLGPVDAQASGLVQIVVGGATRLEPGQVAGIDPEVIELAVRFATAMPGLAEQIETRGQEVTVALYDGGRVAFGPATDLDAKVEALRTVMTGVDTGCLEELDLRVPTRPALSRRPGCR